MRDVVVLCVVWLGLIVVLGVVLTVAAPRFSTSAVDRVMARIEPVVDASMQHLGRAVTAAVVLFSGAGATFALFWVLGRVADHLEGTIDWPVFRWFAARQNADWSDIWLQLTNIGSPTLTQHLSVIGALVFGAAFAYKRMKWWAPPLTFAVAYCLEKFSQHALKLAVDRGHPPTTLGTWPSGGCARIILIYGLFAFFAVVLMPNVSRRTWFAAWSIVALFDGIQAYSRMYNQEHWLTDVIGGILFGLALILTILGFYGVLVRDRDRSASVVQRQLRENPQPEETTAAV